VATQRPPNHPLPLCHDWTGGVALSPPFPPYKYQGREMGEWRGVTEKKKEKQRGGD